MPPTLTPLTVGYFWQAAQARLATNLGASAFWTGDELRSYAVEAIQTWNALARWRRKRLTFNTALRDNPFYDLSQLFSADLGYSVTDASLATLCEYHLLEPPSYPNWTGSNQFSTGDITAAIERRRNQFLLESCTVLQHYAVAQVSPPPSGRTQLPDSILDIRRAAWLDSQSNVYSTLWRQDEFAAASYLPSWTRSAGTPQAYSVATAPDFQIQLIQAPVNSGQLDLVIVPAGSPIDPSAPAPLGIPDDFTWIVKWGVLADLLSKDGPGRDPARAQYCEQRWQQGIEIARIATTVMYAELSGAPVLLNSLFEFDAFAPYWQSKVYAPANLGLAGLNLLSTDCQPDGVYPIVFDAVTNALPGTPTDATAVPVGRDAADAIVDYTEHLALFKSAGAEFDATTPCLERMLRLAGIYNERIRAVAPYAGNLLSRPRVEEAERPMRISA